MRATNQNPTNTSSVLTGASLSAVSWTGMQEVYPCHRPASRREGRSVYIDAFMQRSGNQEEKEKPDGRN